MPCAAVYSIMLSASLAPWPTLPLSFVFPNVFYFSSSSFSSSLTTFYFNTCAKFSSLSISCPIVSFTRYTESALKPHRGRERAIERLREEQRERARGIKSARQTVERNIYVSQHQRPGSPLNMEFTVWNARRSLYTWVSMVYTLCIPAVSSIFIYFCSYNRRRWVIPVWERLQRGKSLFSICCGNGTPRSFWGFLPIEICQSWCIVLMMYLREKPNFTFFWKPEPDRFIEAKKMGKWNFFLSRF